MRMASPRSRKGSRMSCWARLKRWISSRNTTGGTVRNRGIWRLSARNFFSSAALPLAPENSTKPCPVASARMRARVVLPVPGGPHMTMEGSRPPDVSRVSAPLGPSRCAWPTTSSRVVGRRRSGRGMWDMAAGFQPSSAAVLGSRHEHAAGVECHFGEAEARRARQRRCRVTKLPAYERDPFASTLETRVLRSGEERGRPFVILEDTIFYPEGGGQPFDLGTVNGIPVLEVQKREGEIRHYLGGILSAGPASLQLDWARRFDHMQQHTGQHLLTAVSQDRFQWATTAFHLGASVCDIELSALSISLREMEQLEEAVASEIRVHREVSARWVTTEGYAEEAVRSRGLPEGHSGDIRLVQISGVD